MLMKFANQTWKRIPETHRRHIDFEDILQEARIRAWRAIETYDASKGTKLATWVYNTLMRRMREVNAPFTDKARNKKRTGHVMSLDTPYHDYVDDVENTMRTWELPDPHEPAERVESALSSFDRAYQSSDEETQQILLDALGFRVKLDMGSKHTRRVALNVAVQCQLSGDDIRVLRKIEPERTLQVAQRYSSNQPKIECRNCGELYPVSQVGHSIDARTLLCKNCVDALADGDATCFAKAYDAKSLECGTWCPVKTSCAERTKEMANIKLVSGRGKGKSEPENIKLKSEPMTLLSVDEEDDEELDDIDGTLDADEDEDDEIFEDEDDDIEGHVTMTRVSGRSPRKAATKRVPVKAGVAKPALAVKRVAPAKKAPATSAKTSAKKVVKAVAKPAPAKVAPAKTSAKKTVITKAQAVAHVKANLKAKAKPAQRGGSEAGRKLKEFKPHYWTAVSPFRPGSKLQKIVDVLEEKGTVKLAHLKAHVAKQKMNWRGVLNNLRKGASFNGEWQWKLTEDKATDSLTFKFTHKPNREYKALAGEPVREDAVAIKKIKKAA